MRQTEFVKIGNGHTFASSPRMTGATAFAYLKEAINNGPPPKSAPIVLTYVTTETTIPELQADGTTINVDGWLHSLTSAQVDALDQSKTFCFDATHDYTDSQPITTESVLLKTSNVVSVTP
jgi:hypothetical protein